MGDRLYSSVLDLIGRTPIVRLHRVEEYFNLDNELYAKLEFMNPGGSVKDRIALYMLEAAEREGLVKRGAVIIEPTSGNTGIGLALVGNVKGYSVVLVMPKKMSIEKELLLRAMGAFVIRTPTEASPESPLSYYRVAEVVRNLIWKRNGPVSRDEVREIVDHVQDMVDREDVVGLEAVLSLEVEPTPYAYIPNQYFNRYNPLAHYETTAREICEQMDGHVDLFFAGIGTGGTITGIGRFLKEKGDVKVIGIDPVGSIYHLLKSGVPLDEAKKLARPYMVEGIGEDILPATIDLDLVDDIVVVDDQKAFAMARLLVRLESLLVGGSSGAALYGAIYYIKKNNIRGARAVIVFPDTGRNYLSKIFNDEWLRENGFDSDDERVLEVLRK